MTTCPDPRPSFLQKYPTGVRGCETPGPTADMSALLDVILPVFLVIGFGYVAARAGLFDEAAVDGVMRFAQNFARALPALPLHRAAGPWARPMTRA